jgi:hypothetical protein
MVPTGDERERPPRPQPLLRTNVLPPQPPSAVHPVSNLSHGDLSSAVVVAGAGKLLQPPRARTWEVATAFLDVAIVVYWCCNNVFSMLQLVAFMMQPFVVHVAIVANMLHPRSRRVVNVSKFDLYFFDVANISF